MRGRGSSRRARAGRGGFTLLEVLVAMVLLSIALLGWLRVQGAMLHSERSSRARRELAAWLENELSLQRSVPAGACLSQGPVAGWRCALRRRCIAASGGAACDAERIRVVLTPDSGAPLRGTTVVWWPLQRAAIDRAVP